MLLTPLQTKTYLGPPIHSQNVRVFGWLAGGLEMYGLVGGMYNSDTLVQCQSHFHRFIYI